MFIVEQLQKIQQSYPDDEEKRGVATRVLWANLKAIYGCQPYYRKVYMMVRYRMQRFSEIGGREEELRHHITMMGLVPKKLPDGEIVAGSI